MTSRSLARNLSNRNLDERREKEILCSLVLARRLVGVKLSLDWKKMKAAKGRGELDSYAAMSTDRGYPT